jgi:hypothetical protein
MRRLLWLSPVLLAACGGALPAGLPAPGGGATPTASQDAPSYASIDDAQRDLERAEREVATFSPPKADKSKDAWASPPPPPTTPAQPATGGVAPPQAGPPPTGGKPADAAPKSPKREAQQDDARAEAKKADEERSTREPAPCETACRALASMSRAADAICRMAGDADPKCASARKRVDESAARVAQCRCQP